MDHIFPCTPQGGNISQLYPTCYSTRVYIGGIYILLYRSVIVNLKVKQLRITIIIVYLYFDVYKSCIPITSITSEIGT